MDNRTQTTDSSAAAIPLTAEQLNFLKKEAPRIKQFNVALISKSELTPAEFLFLKNSLNQIHPRSHNLTQEELNKNKQIERSLINKNIFKLKIKDGRVKMNFNDLLLKKNTSTKEDNQIKKIAPQETTQLNEENTMLYISINQAKKIGVLPKNMRDKIAYEINNPPTFTDPVFDAFLRCLQNKVARHTSNIQWLIKEKFIIRRGFTYELAPKAMSSNSFRRAKTDTEEFIDIESIDSEADSQRKKLKTTSKIIKTLSNSNQIKFTEKEKEKELVEFPVDFGNKLNASLITCYGEREDNRIQFKPGEDLPSIEESMGGIGTPDSDLHLEPENLFRI